MDLLTGSLSESPTDITVYKQALTAGPCAYCHGRAEVRDHIVPRRWGGRDGWANLIGACHTCNNGKSARSLLSFLMGRVHRARWEAVMLERSLWSQVGQ